VCTNVVQQMVVNSTTWILNLKVLPFTIVRINCTIKELSNHKDWEVVLRNRISKMYLT
jgi:hypothetical protein